MVANNSITRADATFQRLRNDILTGRLSAGARLTFPELSERYDAAVGTIRETVPRLVERGLVEYQPHLGFRVMTPTAEDLRQLTETRVAVETLALQQAVRLGDLAWESNVLAAHHRLAGTPFHLAESQINDAWLEAHTAFHRELLQGCLNRRLTGVAEQLRDSAEIYRWWHAHPVQQAGDIASEHQEILNATLARDIDAATAALTKHLELNAELHLKAHGDEVDDIQG